MTFLESLLGELVVKPVAKLTWLGQRLVVGADQMPPGTTPPYEALAPPPPREPPTGDDAGERGAITIVALLISLFLVGIGFLALETARGFGQRAELAAIADSAAVAGASALDDAAWRLSGSAVLVPAVAEARATEAATSHPQWDADMSVSASATAEGVVVILERYMPLGFISAVLDGAADLHIVVRAESLPDPRAGGL